MQRYTLLKEAHTQYKIFAFGVTHSQNTHTHHTTFCISSFALIALRTHTHILCLCKPPYLSLPVYPVPLFTATRDAQCQHTKFSSNATSHADLPSFLP